MLFHMPAVAKSGLTQTRLWKQDSKTDKRILKSILKQTYVTWGLCYSKMK